MDNINDFRKRSFKLFTDKIIYDLKPFEDQRLEVYKKCKRSVVFFILAALFFIVFIMLFLIIKLPKDCDFLFGIFFGLYGLFLIYLFCEPCFIAKDFERKAKNIIMPLVFAEQLNLKWGTKENITTDMINCSGLFDYNIKSRIDDDCIECQYKDLNIEICETELSHDRGDTGKFFKGLLVCITSKSLNYKGITIVRQNYLNKLRRNYNIKCNLRRVHLEDIEFEKDFDVYSTDQIEARYVLTTAFIERLKNVAKAYKADKTEVSFSENSILIALYNNKDLFKFGSITKSVYSFNQFKTMIEDFVSILEFADGLKLSQKINQ